MTVTSKIEELRNFDHWFKDRGQDWSYLTTTLVFSRDQVGLCQSFCESEYRQRILPKFQRLIEGSRERWNNSVKLAPDLFYYEKDETSLYKRVKRASPHHIHGLLIVPKERLYRVWSEDDSMLVSRLEKDLRSLGYLADWKIESVRGDLMPWLRYITKGGKAFSRL